MRLYTYVKNYGNYSKKELSDLQEKGLITVNGKVTNLSHIIKENEIVLIDGKRVDEIDFKYYIYNKPIGIECTSLLTKETSIFNHLKFDNHMFTVGRLDKESHGLLIITNDGMFSHKCRSESLIEKEYIVTLQNEITDLFLDRLSKPFIIKNKETKKALIKVISNKVISITITEGIYHQVREMVKQSGNKVIDLFRIRIGNILINDLPNDELKEIKNIYNII